MLRKLAVKFDKFVNLAQVMAIGRMKMRLCKSIWNNIDDEPGSDGQFDSNFLRKAELLNKYIIDLILLL